VTFQSGHGNVHDMDPDHDQLMVKNKKNALFKLKKGISKMAKMTKSAAKGEKSMQSRIPSGQPKKSVALPMLALRL
jgi:hypothetical protein